MTRRTLSARIPALAAAAAGIAILTACGTAPGSPSADRSPAGAAQQSLPRVASHASPGHCDGRIGSVDVEGDVRVPAGATCELLGTTVEGNVSIGHRARLYARDVDIDGDVEGEGAALVEVSTGSSVGGNVQLESGATATVRDSHVDGDLSWEDQHGELLATSNTVRGNVALEGNTGRLTVSGNRIGGDLSCQENTPAPRGRANTVSGNQDDQCRGL